MKNQGGQSLVEMAIIAPLLIFFMIGIFEVGMVLRDYIVLVNVNREITRWAVRPGYLDPTDPSAAEMYENMWSYFVTLPGTNGLHMDYIWSEGNPTPVGGKNFGLVLNYIEIEPGNVEMSHNGNRQYPICVPSIADCDCTSVDNLITAGFTPTHSVDNYRWQRGDKAESRIDIGLLAMKERDNAIAASCYKKQSGAVDVGHDIIITEIYLERPQLLGFPLVSNPWTDPTPLYSHTVFRKPPSRKWNDDLQRILQ